MIVNFFDSSSWDDTFDHDINNIGSLDGDPSSINDVMNDDTEMLTAFDLGSGLLDNDAITLGSIFDENENTFGLPELESEVPLNYLLDNDDVSHETENLNDISFDTSIESTFLAQPISPNIDLPNFDPTLATHGYFLGDPAGEISHWHQQSNNDSCAVVAQEFILERLLGQDFSENELRREAISYGWMSPSHGTPLDKTGCLLEAHGIQVERNYNSTWNDLLTELNAKHEVIVAVDSDEIWTMLHGNVEDMSVGDYGALGFMPGQDANHAVQVIGVDYSNPARPSVILNDSGLPDGRGVMVPADRFMHAWADSSFFMMHTTGKNIQPQIHFGSIDIRSPMLGTDQEQEKADYHQDWANDYQKTADWHASYGDLSNAEYHQKGADQEQSNADYHRQYTSNPQQSV